MMHKRDVLFAIRASLQDLTYFWERQRRQSWERTWKSRGGLRYPEQQGCREAWPSSWELEMQGQKGQAVMIKGKCLPQKALQGRKISQASELQLAGLGVLAWELQESPRLCLTLVHVSSCTSPRAGPALESLGGFPQQEEGFLPRGASAPADPGTGGCSEARRVGKASPHLPGVCLAASPQPGLPQPPQFLFPSARSETSVQVKHHGSSLSLPAKPRVLMQRKTAGGGASSTCAPEPGVCESPA